MDTGPCNFVNSWYDRLHFAQLCQYIYFLLRIFGFFITVNILK